MENPYLFIHIITSLESTGAINKKNLFNDLITGILQCVKEIIKTIFNLLQQH